MTNLIYRKPVKKDSKDIVNIIKECRILDLNSEYLYLLQTTHFKESCCVLENNNKIIGFVSGYYLPEDPKTLFIWQVAVDEQYRGKNLAFSMIKNIIDRREIDFLISTVSPSNISSTKVFEKVAQYFNTKLEKKVLFTKNDFCGFHEDEVQFTIKKEIL
ncbi:diaminobutyrate acetyltransferase [Aliarcobacter vitoriensis]|uniref:L-2,4-diaminobutyric acid acetyltransferase n=1 Tax=Aliarcobacter vitoriensis TaxID=2011099 RepID=A0A366MQN3_9BACT|nr:diaminobutyrate acetyltransferase [Aliarcobacter vitoriensis]